jgi:hypothetical protein
MVVFGSVPPPELGFEEMRMNRDTQEGTAIKEYCEGMKVLYLI